MHTLRWLCVVLFCLVVSTGSAKALVMGLATGHYFFSRRGPPLRFETSPVLYGLATLLLIAAALLFARLAWSCCAHGPEWVEQGREESARLRHARYTERQDAPAPSLTNVLLKTLVAIGAVVAGYPFTVGLATVIGPDIAHSIYGLWILAFALWVTVNTWRCLRDDS